MNHTVCADQISQSVPVWIYEWSHFITFLAAAMGKDALFPARDDLARVNVMAYREGEALNWHFDRSEFTTTLLLQAPERAASSSTAPICAATTTRTMTAWRNCCAARTRR